MTKKNPKCPLHNINKIKVGWEWYCVKCEKERIDRISKDSRFNHLHQLFIGELISKAVKRGVIKDGELGKEEVATYEKAKNY